jgi:hypothetical protein
VNEKSSLGMRGVERVRGAKRDKAGRRRAQPFSRGEERVAKKNTESLGLLKPSTDFPRKK